MTSIKHMDNNALRNELTSCANTSRNITETALSAPCKQGKSDPEFDKTNQLLHSANNENNKHATKILAEIGTRLKQNGYAAHKAFLDILPVLKQYFEQNKTLTDLYQKLETFKAAPNNQSSATYSPKI